MNSINGDSPDVFEEEIHPNCTVIVYTSVTTGQQQICWYDNDKPPVDLQDYGNDD